MISCAMSIGAFLLGGVAATAQQPPTIEEQVVVTGSVAPATRGAVGRSVTVITAADLRGLPIRTVTDALRLVPGLWVRSRGPFGSQTDVSLRGAGFGQVLVLLDGVRLNDVQSGHHNGDLPLNLDDIDRIEVLSGAGASLFGADAVGGTIHIITKRGASAPSVEVVTGQHGYGQVQAAWRPSDAGPLRAVSATFERADGFVPVRDFRHGQMRAAVQLGATSLTLSHLDKAFGAAGYYGPAPSREWTTQTVLSADGVRKWRDTTRVQHTAWYRTHGDRFLYNSLAVGAVPNRHRTHSTGGTVRVFEQVREGLRVSAGGELALDVIRSSALGDHDEIRGSGFAELEATMGRIRLYPGLRLDGYSAFGHAWSPSLAVAWQVVPRVKARAAGGRAFRIPTFTERYYRDPNHLATATLRPERGWTGETGLDWYPAGSWTASATAFRRRDHDVIDWVRVSASERWQTSNIRDVSTRGFEGSVRGRAAGVALGGQYAWTVVETDQVVGLSKYVLDYARHGLSGDVVVPIGERTSASLRVEHRRPRSRPVYTLLDVRAQRQWGRLTVFGEASNLLSARYQEVTGVEMPGRWVRTGIAWR